MIFGHREVLIGAVGRAHAEAQRARGELGAASVAEHGGMSMADAIRRCCVIWSMPLSAEAVAYERNRVVSSRSARGSGFPPARE